MDIDARRYDEKKLNVYSLPTPQPPPFFAMRVFISTVDGRGSRSVFASLTLSSVRAERCSTGTNRSSCHCSIRSCVPILFEVVDERTTEVEVSCLTSSQLTGFGKLKARPSVFWKLGLAQFSMVETIPPSLGEHLNFAPVNVVNASRSRKAAMKVC